LKTSELGINLITHFEGCELKAYKDSGGVVTIGYGTTIYPSGNKVQEGDKCSHQEAVLYLKNDLIKAEKKVNKLINIKLTQNQFDALVSCVYNVGYGKTLFDTINKRLGSIWGAFILYVKDSKGKELLGLKRRRNAEAHLYIKNEIDYYEDLK